MQEGQRHALYRQCREREMMGITIEDATIDSVIVLRWKGNSTIGNGHGGIGYLIPTFSIRWPGIRIIRVEIHSEGRAVTVWWWGLT